jgi:myo-inositol-1(or 4)-monophosphatase
MAVPLVLESEEGPSRIIGGEAPEWRLIADPVDGSDNQTRGLPSSAFSCAVLAADAALRPEAVVAAIVGPMEGEEAWVATLGAGAWHGSARLTTSTVTDLAEAMISVELNHCHPSPALGRIMGLARGVRSYGCASRALALVAAGAIDAHIDIRDRLTVESWLAGGFLVQEAGGCVVGPDGGPVPAPASLLERRSLLAAATPELCRRIVRELGSHDD